MIIFDINLTLFLHETEANNSSVLGRWSTQEFQAMISADNFDRKSPRLPLTTPHPVHIPVLVAALSPSRRIHAASPSNRAWAHGSCANYGWESRENGWLVAVRAIRHWSDVTRLRSDERWRGGSGRNVAPGSEPWLPDQWQVNRHHRGLQGGPVRSCAFEFYDVEDALERPWRASWWGDDDFAGEMVSDTGNFTKSLATIREKQRSVRMAPHKIGRGVDFLALKFMRFGFVICPSEAVVLFIVLCSNANRNQCLLFVTFERRRQRFRKF